MCWQDHTSAVGVLRRSDMLAAVQSRPTSWMEENAKSENAKSSGFGYKGNELFGKW